ncbi:MAG: hypothetical protein GXO11_08080 [Epsilonproteobacteria bacterium]|nr:hypothetical protein [Campylobacterota bacterium]
MRRFKERRKCSKYQPLFFLFLEILVYLEIIYIIITIIGKSQLIYISSGVVFTFLLAKSIQRFLYVQRRCKQINAYNKYQEKLYVKMSSK